MPHGQRRLLLAVLALVSVLACETLTGPDVNPADVQIDIDAGFANYREPPIVVTGDTGAIVVEGTFTVGHTNHVLQPALQRLGRGRYQLILEARDAGLGLTIVTRYRYRALLHPWPAGAYHLQIVLRLPDSSQHEVFDDQVLVH